MLRVLTDYLEAHESGKKLNYYIKVAEPDNYNIFYILFAPTAGIYKDQKHILEMKLKFSDHQYPLNSPLVKFHTKMFHTNISHSGSICVDILNNASNWQPSYNFTAIINSILMLLEDHNNSSPYNCDASQCYKDCMNNFEEAKKHLTETLNPDQEEELKNKYLQPFIEETRRFYRTEILKDYVKHFSILESDNRREMRDEDYDAEHFNEIKMMIEGLKNNGKKKNSKKSETTDKANVNVAELAELDKADVDIADGSSSKKAAVSKTNKWEKFKSLDKKSKKKDTK
jgi:ubiquitin-protein ligase